jgi:hypothetical protein
LLFAELLLLQPVPFSAQVVVPVIYVFPVAGGEDVVVASGPEDDLEISLGRGVIFTRYV